MPRRSRPGVESLEGKALLSGLVVSLTTDYSTYTPGPPVQMTLTETNTGLLPAKVVYGPSDDGFSVSEGGVTVWDTNHGAAVPQYLVLDTLEPGQSLRVTGAWDGTQVEGAPASPTGTFVVHNALAPGTTATITIGGSPSPRIAHDPMTSPVTPPSGPSPGVVTTDAATAEANGLYRQILGRDAEPAGLANAVAAIRGGTTAAQLATGLTESAEHRADVVQAEYHAYLGRPASPGEVATVSAALKSGLSSEGLAAGLLGSAEFNQDHAQDGNFAQAAYQAILGRSASTTEATAVVGALATGTSRSAVVGSLLGSAEADLWAVDGLYGAILNRPADPIGLASSVTALKAGVGLESLAAGLVRSPEFAARAAADTIG